MDTSISQAHFLSAPLPSIASSPTAKFRRNTVFLGRSLGHRHALLTAGRTRRRGYTAPGPVRVVCEKVVGIDLGTTNSAVAAMEGGKPTIITNVEGQTTTPSVVAYTKTGDRLVGQIAKRLAVVNPENTFFSVKRFIGRKMSEVDEESKQVSYRVIRDDNDNAKLDCPAIGKQFAAEEISAQVLRKLVDDAAKFLNDTVNKAVITVPAHFSESQRTATKDAGRIAGLDVLRIINEPTAASLAYGFEKKNNETILVFDLRGSTFDVSVLEVGDGVFEVLSTSSDTHLGGDDSDKRIVDWLAENFKWDEGIDLLKDKQSLQCLTEPAEKAKIELSTLTQTSISLPFITATPDGRKHIDTTLTRAKFEELCSDLLDGLKTPIEASLRDSQLSIKDIDEVILVGGSTRILAVQDLVKKMTGKDPNCTVNPDEVVALGAAVQASVLDGDVSDIVVLDVTPLSPGLETLGGVMTKIIPQNTTLPTSKLEVFSTAADGQTSVEINVLQGESEFVRDNKSLGSFRLDGIPPAPRGVPQIEGKFDIDANVNLSVTAIGKGTGKKQDITITGASTLPKDEVMASAEIPPPLKVMISGAPASGKGTQCELITQKYGLVHIAAGDLLRAEIASGSENGMLAEEYMEKGQLVPDEIVVMMVKGRLSQSDSIEKGWLLDGYPRSSSQANALKDLGFQPDLFILLEVSEDMLVERVIGRRLDPVTGKIYHLKYSPPESEEIAARLTQRFDDTEEKVKLRLATHHQNVEAVLSMYEDITVKVNGDVSMEDVFAQIDAALSKLLEEKLAAGTAEAP